MAAWLLFPLLGLAAGAVYAAIAIGVILVYRGSGVVNLAAGAMAMFPAVVFVRLQTTGELVLPIVGLPGRIGLGDPWPVLPAVVVAVAMGALIGALAYLLIFRYLRDSPPITRLVASVGLTIVLQGAAVTQVGTTTERAEPILPDRLIEVQGSVVPTDRFWLVGVVVLIGSAVAALYRFTRFGLATRAAAENAKGAILMGKSPSRLGLGNWVLAAVVASVAGILMSPISGVNPFNYSLFVVPALAAALAARLRSFAVAMAAGIAIGMFEGFAVHLVSRRQVPDFLLGGIDTVVPFLAIVIVLVVFGRSVPDRGTLLDRRFPEAPMPSRRPYVVGGLLLAAFALMTFGDASMRLAAITSMMVAIICLSFVLLTGYLGQVSLAQLTLVGFSAFVLARASSEWGLPFPIAPLIALTATTALGVLISLPALRIRGIQIAIVTLAAAVAIEQLLFRNPSFVGSGGLAHVDPPEVFGVEFAITGPGPYPYRPFGYFVLILLVRGRSHGAGRPARTDRTADAGRAGQRAGRRGQRGQRRRRQAAGRRALLVRRRLGRVGLRLQERRLLVVGVGGVAGAATAGAGLPRRRGIGVGRADRRRARPVRAAPGGPGLAAGGRPAARPVGHRVAPRHGALPPRPGRRRSLAASPAPADAQGRPRSAAGSRGDRGRALAVARR